MSFAIYEKIIEAQVESKSFGNALQTFNKIKKFNLDSMEADNVDYDTPKNKAIELSNFDGNDVLKSYYEYDKYVSTTLGCQINEYTRLAFLDFLHSTLTFFTRLD